MLTRRHFCLSAAAGLLTGFRSFGHDVEIRTSQHKAIEWLLKQQDTDGAWRSKNYATLKSGYALTPLVYQAIDGMPDLFLPRTDWRKRALTWITAAVDPDGSVGRRDPELKEYPTYASALTLLCLQDNQPVREQIGRFLQTQQCQEANGFDSNHPAYGGFGFDAPAAPDNPGHVDLAHTRWALAALKASNQLTPAIIDRARRFLRLLQKLPSEADRQPKLVADLSARVVDVACDGGFYFSPIVHPANKAGIEIANGKPVFRSYMTATCEGYLAQSYVGNEDQRSALDWLKRHPRFDVDESIPANDLQHWSDSTRFYRIAVRTMSLPPQTRPLHWQSQVADVVRTGLQPDGSVVNTAGNLMKEDDPILCTALAVMALNAAFPRYDGK